MADISRVIRMVESRPWMIQPEKAREIAEVLAIKAEHGQLPTATELKEAGHVEPAARMDGPPRIGRSSGTIAVLKLFGTVSRRMNMLDAMSGGTSIEEFGKSFDELVADADVTDIVILVDSPGGSVYGVEELSRKIHAAREQKRIVAVVDALAASAAYYIASAADEIVVTPSGEVGSIGVFMIHFDHSGQLEGAGIKPTIVKAGDNKAETHPAFALTDEAQAHLQMLIDDYYGQFVRAVARNRGVSTAEVEERFGQGRTFTAQRALDAGMVDRIATFEDVIADLTGGEARAATKGPRRRRRAAAAAAAVAAHLEHSDSSPFDIAAIVGEPTQRFLAATVTTTGATTGAEPAAPSATFEVNRAALGEVASDEDPSPVTQPAPVAKGEPMSEHKDTAAHIEGAVDVDAVRESARAEALQAERERVRQIRDIARSAQAEGTSFDAEAVDGWINSNMSVEQVQAVVRQLTKFQSANVENVVVGNDRAGDAPFLSLGEQLVAIREAGVAQQTPGMHIDPRLQKIQAAATGAGEAVPSDGGFLLQPEFTDDILRRAYDLGEIASRVRRRPIGPNSNGLKLKAIDETSRANGSRYGGIQAYWADEADTVTASKPKFRTMELSLNKLMAIMYSTEELLEDAVALQGIAEDAFAEEISFKVEDAVFRGTGAGQPLGFLNSSALVTVAKETSQTAATINAQNVVKMFARMWPRSRMNAAWFVNVDAEPQLPLMTIGDQPVYMPPGGLSSNPYGTLLGRPVIPVEYCQTVGTVGDIVLADLDQYMMIDKGGTKQSWSIHVRFIYDEQTFKITYRCDGQPLWNQALTPFKGTNTLSPFVVLAERS